MRILVGLPAYNEEGTIEAVVMAIDKGLREYLPKDDSASILLVDSDSTDSTVEVFSNLRISFSKECIVNKSRPRGKGANLLEIFKVMIRDGYDYLLLFDTDLRSIEPMWMDVYLQQIIRNHVDLITPVYSRNKFEGSATNHFTFPILYALTGYCIRQPIAGDFGMSRALVQALLNIDFHPDTLLYGIDVFITYSAMQGAFKIGQIKLSKKIHKASFPNLAIMFPQIANSLLYQLEKRPFRSLNRALKACSSYFLDDISRFDHYAEALNLKKQALLSLRQRLKNSLFEGITLDDDMVTDQQWASVLSRVIKNIPISKENLAVLSDLYIVRVVSFWESILETPQREVEDRIVNVSILLNKSLT